MTPIEQIREALEEAQKRIDDMKSCLHDSGIYESELDDTYSDIADALSLLSSMEGQTKTESYREHAWEARGMNGHWWCLNCGICGGNGTAPANVGPCVDHGPVDTCSESPSVPCISVEDAMEAYQNHMLAFGLHVGMKTDRAADLLERLTKAAK